MNASDTFRLTIESAREEHLSEIASLAAMIWRAHYPGIISRDQIDYMLGRMYDVGVLRSELANGIRFERAIVDGELRGFSSFGSGSSAKEVKLLKLYVHPDWQRHGIGSALLKSVLEVEAVKVQRLDAAFLDEIRIGLSSTSNLRNRSALGFCRSISQRRSGPKGNLSW